jgi:hypothetical protein
MPDFMRVGNTTYRFDPMLRLYEKQTPGRPIEYAHADSFPAQGELREWEESENQVPRLRPPCRQSTDSFRSRTVFAYAYRSDQASTVPLETQEIRRVIEQINWTFWHESSLASGGADKLQLVVDCNAAGELLVPAVEVNASERWELEGPVMESTYGASGGYGIALKYMIFDNSTAGGRPYTFMSNDSRKTINNSNNLYARTAFMPANGCVCDGEDTLHELLHDMGAVQGFENNKIPPAPYSTSYGHCTDGTDVMCYDDGSPQAENYSASVCPAWKNESEQRKWRIDCKNNTYFNPVAVEKDPESWLAKNWNVGEPQNPFLIDAPEAETKSATGSTAESATLRGNVNPERARHGIG